MQDNRIILGFGGTEENLRALDAKSGSVVTTYQGHTAKVTDVAVAGEYILSGGADDQLLLWKARKYFLACGS